MADTTRRGWPSQLVPQLKPPSRRFQKLGKECVVEADGASVGEAEEEEEAAAAEAAENGRSGGCKAKS